MSKLELSAHEVNRAKWAAAMLGAPADATPDQLRRAFLVYLAENDFLPHEAAVDAWRIASQTTSQRADRVAHDPLPFSWYSNRQLHTEIDTFASEFFSLPSIERRRRWCELRDQAPVGTSELIRLNALAPALDITRPEGHANHEAEAISDCICRCFPLDPFHRPAVERAFLAKVAAHPAKWESAARRFRRQQPELAQLLPRFLDRLSTLRSLKKQDEKKARQRLKQVRKAAKQQTSNNAGIWIVLVIIGSSVLSALRNTERTSVPPNNYYGTKLPSQPTYRPPTPPITRDLIIRWFEMSDEEFNRSPERSAVIPLGFQQVRFQYREELQKIHDAHPDGGLPLDADATSDQAPEVKRERLQRQLLRLQRDLEVARLRSRIRMLYPIGLDDTPDPSREAELSMPIKVAMTIVQSELDRLSNAELRPPDDASPTLPEASAHDPDTKQAPAIVEGPPNN